MRVCHPPLPNSTRDQSTSREALKWTTTGWRTAPTAGTKRDQAPTIMLASTLFSGCGRNGSRRELGPNSTSCETTNFYAIGSCFARGIEHALTWRGVTVESMAPEFAKFQPVNKEVTGLGFTNKYNTFSILNELRWALDPDATFPVDSKMWIIFQVTKLSKTPIVQQYGRPI